MAAIFRKKLHLAPRLVWRVCDVLSYGVVLVPVPHAESSKVGWDPTNDWAVDEEEQHIDTALLERLETPARVPRWGQFSSGPYVHVAFDGGAREGVGTAGYVIADAKGREVVRAGLHLGSGVTNNEAEGRAVEAAMKRLALL